VAQSQDDPVVLVVDDEEDVADTYALRLHDGYQTRVAYGGEEALEKIDDTVDAVLLDRRMPKIHGDDVLAEIRERDHDCVVIMATAVDPDLNILEMDFDDYLCKPIFRDTLVGTIEQHLEDQSRENADLEDFLRIISKIEVLESELSGGDLAESDEYRELKNRAEKLGATLSDRVDDFDRVVETYRQINRSS
jgi:DNA-binding response OmpR family regulator